MTATAKTSTEPFADLIGKDEATGLRHVVKSGDDIYVQVYDLNERPNFGAADLFGVVEVRTEVQDTLTSYRFVLADGQSFMVHAWNPSS